MGIEWTSCPLDELWQEAPSLQILLTAKGHTPVGCAWTMFVCPSEWRRRAPERIIQVTFFIGVGLFVLLDFFGSRREGGSRGQGALLSERVKWQLTLPTVSPSWATGSGLDPSFAYFSWDYFVQRLGRA